eukprot:TRINITY_DN1713_c0_g1_i1.p1 TRINITY_DN1713_c0_g1~~TRINITY_DN1713_c0_g1_i1.p1  ORF type:complete len:162 (-),score=55.52 TRINITY_DN1713_c0_g1_i1:441-881(-)
MAPSCCRATLLLVVVAAAHGFVSITPGTMHRSGSLGVVRDREGSVFDSEGTFSMQELDTDSSLQVTEADMKQCFQTGECEIPQEFEKKMTKAFNQVPYVGTKQTMTVVDGDSEHEEPVPWAGKWSEVDDDIPVEAYQNESDAEFDI